MSTLNWEWPFQLLELHRCVRCIYLTCIKSLIFKYHTLAMYLCLWNWLPSCPFLLWVLENWNRHFPSWEMKSCHTLISGQDPRSEQRNVGSRLPAIPWKTGRRHSQDCTGNTWRSPKSNDGEHDRWGWTRALHFTWLRLTRGLTTFHLESFSYFFNKVQFLQSLLLLNSFPAHCPSLELISKTIQAFLSRAEEEED